MNMDRKHRRYSCELKKTVVKKYFEGHAIQALIKEYNISAPRVAYRWVNKVREGGYEALNDTRGMKSVGKQKKNKDEEETKNEIIEKQALQIEYLKKLLELERM